ncbi:hypothetical protein AB1Y20_006932 [Prymnesium parvum]|uniref:UDENN domain-containing protein n=1 Tax=Prymnesium parvum TaxID=97485 RepID=A0AB34J0A9_PRYPA
MEPFVEYVCLAALLDADDRSRQRARVVQRLPSHDSARIHWPPLVATFALPAGAAPRPIDAPRPATSCHSATLTQENGTRIYLVALTFYSAARRAPPPHRREWAPRALCLLSRWPLLEQMGAALRLLRAAMLSSRAALASAVLSLLSLPLPLPGIELRLPLAGAHFHLHAAPEGAPRRLGVPIAPFLSSIGAVTVLSVLEVLCAELRLVMISREIGRLGSSAEALLALLQPLEWPHTYIPLLPSQWIDYLDAPCPFVIGVHSREGTETEALAPPHDVCVLDLDTAQFTLPPSVLPAVLPFPEADKRELLCRLEACLKRLPAAAPAAAAPPALAAEVDEAVDEASRAVRALASRWEDDGDVQLAFNAFWRRMLHGFGAHVRNGADLDAEALLESRPPARRPFLRRLLDSAPMQRFLERAAQGDIIDGLVLPFLDERASSASFSQKTGPPPPSAAESPSSSSRGEGCEPPSLTTIELPAEVPPMDGYESPADDDNGELEPLLHELEPEEGLPLEIESSPHAETPSGGATPPHDRKRAGRRRGFPVPSEAIGAAIGAAAARGDGLRGIPALLMHAAALLRSSGPRAALEVCEEAYWRGVAGEADGADRLKLHPGIGRGTSSMLDVRLVNLSLDRIDVRELAELALVRTPTPAVRADVRSPAAPTGASLTPSGESSAPASQRAEESPSPVGGRASCRAISKSKLPLQARSPPPSRLHSTPPALSHRAHVARRVGGWQVQWARAYLESTHTATQRHSEPDEEPHEATDADGEWHPKPTSVLVRRLHTPSQLSASPNDPPDGWGLAIPWPRAANSKLSAPATRCGAVDPVELFRQLHTAPVTRARASSGSRTSSFKELSEVSSLSEERAGHSIEITSDDFEKFGSWLLQASRRAPSPARRRRGGGGGQGGREAVHDAPDITELWRCLLADEAREAAGGAPSAASSTRAPPPAGAAAPHGCLSLGTFERWYSRLYESIRPDSEWRAKLALTVSERLVKRTRPASVRDHPFAVPGMLLLTSERLLFGTVTFVTAAALSALMQIEALEINWGDCALRLAIDGPGAEPLLLRFGRTAAAHAERDDWLSALEEMRRAYSHAWAMGSEVPIIRAAHCVACAAAFGAVGGGRALLKLEPPKPFGSTLRLRSTSRERQGLRLSRLVGDISSEGSLRVSAIGAMGSLLCVGFSGGELHMYRVHASLPDASGGGAAAAESAAAQQLVSALVGRALCGAPPRWVGFAGSRSSRARALSLAAGQVRLWDRRLAESKLLPAAGAQAQAVRVAVLNRAGPAKVTKLAVAVVCADGAHQRNPPMVLVYECDDEDVKQVRRLLLPEPVLQLEWCGSRYLCVAHRSEYVLISTTSGAVRELFRFTADFGMPFVKRLSDNEILAVQPPPCAGERQLGVIIGTRGDAAAYSNVHWRWSPLACLSRLPFLVVMLPHTVEIHQLGREQAADGATASRTRLLQSLPFPHALCAAEGDILYFANSEAIYALLPPTTGTASSQGSLSSATEPGMQRLDSLDPRSYLEQCADADMGCEPSGADTEVD